MTKLPKTGKKVLYLYSTIICHYRHQLLGISQKPYHTIFNFKAAEKDNKAITSYIAANNTRQSQETETRA